MSITPVLVFRLGIVWMVNWSARVIATYNSYTSGTRSNIYMKNKKKQMFSMLINAVL